MKQKKIEAEKARLLKLERDKEAHAQLGTAASEQTRRARHAAHHRVTPTTASACSPVVCDAPTVLAQPRCKR
jgi:hypothetical protein